MFTEPIFNQVAEKLAYNSKRKLNISLHTLLDEVFGTLLEHDTETKEEKVIRQEKEKVRHHDFLEVFLPWAAKNKISVKLKEYVYAPLQPKLFNTDLPKVKGISLKSFEKIVRKADQTSIDSSLTGVQFDDGCMIGGNGHILIVLASDKYPQYEGKLIDPFLDEEILGKRFVDYRRYAPMGIDVIEVNIPNLFEALLAIDNTQKISSCTSSLIKLVVGQTELYVVTSLFFDLVEAFYHHGVETACISSHLSELTGLSFVSGKNWALIMPFTVNEYVLKQKTYIHSITIQPKGLHVEGMDFSDSRKPLAATIRQTKIDKFIQDVGAYRLLDSIGKETVDKWLNK